MGICRTILVSVPRIYEKVHAGINAKMASAPSVKKALFNWAMGLARQNLPSCNNKERTGWFAFKYNLADKIIFSKLKVTLGMDKLKGAVSGGGPLSVSDASSSWVWALEFWRVSVSLRPRH